MYYIGFYPKDGDSPCYEHLELGLECKICKRTLPIFINIEDFFTFIHSYLTNKELTTFFEKNSFLLYDCKDINFKFFSIKEEDLLIKIDKEILILNNLYVEDFSEYFIFKNVEEMLLNGKLSLSFFKTLSDEIKLKYFLKYPCNDKKFQTKEIAEEMFKYNNRYFIHLLDEFKTEEMCIIFLKNNRHEFHCIPERYHNQEWYVKAVEKYESMLLTYPINPYIPTQEEKLSNLKQKYKNMGFDDLKDVGY